MRALVLAALAPLAAAQTVAPEDAPVVLDGRCETGVPMPTLDLEGADPASMPALDLEDESTAVPMPNFCGDVVALAFEAPVLEVLPFEPPLFRGRRFAPGSTLDGTPRWFERYRLGRGDAPLPPGIPRLLPSPLVDPLVAPPDERP
ncbi:hypothetical protein [Rubrivirga sp.]|uniref:hypothetical protein n=1 Tax=Rubrivirga sp. TaxID=1885344 RepID=UPI003C745A59